MALLQARVSDALAGEGLVLHRDFATTLTTALTVLIARAPGPVVLALSDAPHAPEDVAAAFLLGQVWMAQRVMATTMTRLELRAFAGKRGRLPHEPVDCEVSSPTGP